MASLSQFFLFLEGRLCELLLFLLLLFLATCLWPVINPCIVGCETIDAVRDDAQLIRRRDVGHGKENGSDGAVGSQRICTLGL